MPLQSSHLLSNHSPWTTWMGLSKAEAAGAGRSARSSRGLGKCINAFQPPALRGEGAPVATEGPSLTVAAQEQRALG